MGQTYHPSYANHVLLVTKSFYWISSNYYYEPMAQIPRMNPWVELVSNITRAMATMSC